ncbi:MAG: ribosomal protein S18-alanine N-acetyltransferase [Clostridia bacterium]|nr:ribosomal protein S18-alanine N-acetyltransferase [Clostridia bacterium]
MTESYNYSRTGGAALDNLTITPFTKDDIDAILEAERVCFTHPWTREDFAAALDCGYVCLAARENGALAGYAVAMAVADEATVANVAVLPEFRGRGAAKALLAASLAACRERGAAVCFLEVRESNKAARKLYESFGFTGIAVRRGYYDSPVEDAVIMKKELSE